MSSSDLDLVQAYLSNVQFALQNFDVVCAESFLEHALALLSPTYTPFPFSLPMQIDVGVGLDTGMQRKGKPNEDFVFATTGYSTPTQQAYGIFVVADGMGGHANGKEASQLATEIIVDTIFPLVHNECVQGSEVGTALVDAVKQANATLYERNLKVTRLLDRMGTTAIIALVIGPHAFIANIGDSRAYLYRPSVGLRVISQDHSVVAALIASGAITPDEAYTHPKRNQVLRCLGTAPMVDVDLFYEQLQNGDTLLLCSDGLWEMVRDPQIEQFLAASWWSTEQRARRLVDAALRGGGLDNIGLVVSQFQTHVADMETAVGSISDYPTAS